MLNVIHSYDYVLFSPLRVGFFCEGSKRLYSRPTGHLKTRAGPRPSSPLFLPRAGAGGGGASSVRLDAASLLPILSLLGLCGGSERKNDQLGVDHVEPVSGL